MTVKRSYLISAAALALVNFLPVHAAEQDTVQAIIPWEASGRVFQVDTSTMMNARGLRHVSDHSEALSEDE
jgi:hypothetical protein